MQTIAITLEQARSIALKSSLYSFSTHQGKQGTLEAIRRLSYVQIDTISVIERAHHHTLYNRVKDYQPSYLNDLLSKDQAVWEYWAHAASYIPIVDFPFYTHRMHSFPNGSWEKSLWAKHHDLAKPILDRIRSEGALSAKHFLGEKPMNLFNGWGGWKPAKIMLELLMWKGDLMVTARDGFQRVYDLTERVVPADLREKIPTEAERLRFMIIRTLSTHGIANEDDIKNHIRVAPIQAIPAMLKTMLHSGEILPVRIDGIRDLHYIFPEQEVSLQTEPIAIPKRVYLLSPFDNAVILRRRLQRLWGFDYTIECYVTPAKRIYGYWTMPVLYQNRFVGRIDPKADRKTRKLIINSLYIERKVHASRTFQSALEKELIRFAGFNGCDNIELRKVVQT